MGGVPGNKKIFNEWHMKLHYLDPANQSVRPSVCPPVVPTCVCRTITQVFFDLLK